MENSEQILDVDLSQLEIKDGTRKRQSNTVNEDNKANNSSSKQITESLRRSSRKQIRPLESVKRRVLSKPKKLLDDLNSKEVVDYYLDKKVKRLPSTLETIFEDPTAKAVMSSRKFRRCINFPSDIATKNKLKVKKRGMKAKQVSHRPRTKVTMESLLLRLSSIDDQ